MTWFCIALARTAMIGFLKRRMSLPRWAFLALALALGALVYAVAQTRADRDAAKVAKWVRRPIVSVCEPRPGERIELGRTVPTGPEAEPDAEPVQFIIRMQGCETFTPPVKEQTNHE